jgi:glycosyltransferase involved in cell wall biosynthesis
MKIAFVSTIMDYPWGGADFLWTQAAEASVERGDAVLLVISKVVAKHPRIAALVARGASVHLRKAKSSSVSFSAKLGRRLRRCVVSSDPEVKALGKFRPDLVIFSCGATYDLAYFPRWVDWLLSTRTAFRLIANWQSEQPVLAPVEREQIVRVFLAADALYFVSTRNLDATRQHLRETLPKARVIHNPLRWQTTDATAWPASPPWSLATVSRLDSGKGIDLFLQAAAQVLPRNDEWQINIHGMGPEETALKALVMGLDLQQRVRFQGYVPDLRTIWGANHLMVSPSLEDGVPMTIPEALLCQRPVLATAIGGAEDWVRDEVSGFLCSSPTLAPFARALQRAWDHREQWETMGRTGAAEAIARYRPNDYLQLIQR